MISIYSIITTALLFISCGSQTEYKNERDAPAPPSSTPAEVEEEVLPTAVEGPQGDQGPQGYPGVDGADGQDGNDGADGVDGEDGQDGDHAYMLSVRTIPNRGECVELIDGSGIYVENELNYADVYNNDECKHLVHDSGVLCRNLSNNNNNANGTTEICWIDNMMLTVSGRAEDMEVRILEFN